MEPLRKLNSKLFFYVSLLTVPLMVSVVYGVVTRYFVGRADPRAFFLSVWLYGIVSVLAGGYLVATEGHVYIDLVYKRLSESARKAMDILSLVAIIAACAVIAVPGVQVAWRSTVINEVDSSLGIIFAPPIWWYRWVAVAGVVLVLVQALELLYRRVRPR